MSRSFEFALNLLKTASSGTTSFVISPLSLGTALATVHVGAKEDTEQELTKLLGKDLSPDEVSALYASMTAEFAERNSSDVLTMIANALFVDKRFDLNPDYIVCVAKAFAATVQTLDFKDGEESARHANAFVESKTNGTIVDLMTPAAFTAPNTLAILINTVYIKAEWQTQFLDFLTQPERIFHGVEGDRDAEFMISDGKNQRYSLSDDLTVVSLAYKDPAYALVVLMPKGDFAAWRDGLCAHALHAAIAGLQTGKIDLELPKFKIESTTDGEKALEKLGVTDIFSSRANLSGISDQELCVSHIYHKAVIEVSEEGTIATAASECRAIALGMDEEKKLTFDSPFLFVLTRGCTAVFIGQHC